VTIARFYLIVDRADRLDAFLPLGLRLVQLRAKDLPPDAIDAEVGSALARCRAAGATLVVNDHWRAAIDAGAPWVHLGQEDLDTADLPAIRRCGLQLGISTHDHAELDRALSADPDYVALGPIWPTTLKPMRFGPQGLARIGEWKAIARRPVVAIGGITLERGPDVYAAGADSIAVVSDVLAARDPVARCRAWLALAGGGGVP
jgi:thiamine-phosphate diphosphorylase